MRQMRSMGPISDLLGMLPGVNKQALAGAQVDEKAMSRIEAIIQSMTPDERDNPGVLGSSRKRRIAAGSGVKVEDVNKLLKQFRHVLQDDEADDLRAADEDEAQPQGAPRRRNASLFNL